MELLTRKLLETLPDSAFMTWAISHRRPGCNWVGDGVGGVLLQKVQQCIMPGNILEEIACLRFSAALFC